MSIRAKMIVNATMFAAIALYLVGFEMTYILNDRF